MRPDRPLDLTHSEACKRRFPTSKRSRFRLQRWTSWAGGLHDVPSGLKRGSLSARSIFTRHWSACCCKTAKQILGEPGLFQRRGEFPAIRDGGLPGQSTGTEILRIRHAAAAAISALLAGGPDRQIARLAASGAGDRRCRLDPDSPSALCLEKRSKIYRWYGELKFLEQHARTCPQSELGRFSERLGEIRTRPSAGRHSLFANELYTLREHVALVRASIISGIATARPHPKMGPA